MPAPLSSAPLTGHPLQGRYEPGGQTGPGDYGVLPPILYGDLPCDLLVCEMKGPRAFLMKRDGTVPWSDGQQRGRWVDVDARTGGHIIGAPGYRTARWMSKAGALLNTWVLPPAILGEIYGLRVCGARMIVTTYQTNNYCELWIFDLDAAGYPVGAGVKFSGFEGAAKFCRSAIIVGDKLWVASMVLPVSPSGSQGALECYSLTTGLLIESHPGDYPNDVDVLSTGEVVWIDEHLDRMCGVMPGGVPRVILAGSAYRAGFDPNGTQSAYTNHVLHATRDGSKLSMCATEYAGRDSLYAPNGLRVIADNLVVIADTDNSRIIVVRLGDGWRPEVTAIIHPLNEPTKVAISPR